MSEFRYDDLTGRADKDRNRYKEKVGKALRGNLDSVITGENIISAPDGKKVRIRIKDIREPRFRPPDPPQDADFAGTGAGDGGDPIATLPKRGEGGSGAGTEHLEPYVDVEVPLEEVAAWVFSDLQLPVIEAKKGEETEENFRLTARGKRGVILDRKKSYLNHMLRRKATGSNLWSQDDLTYRNWHVTKEPTFQAVMFLVRDASGSIDDEMRYIIRLTSFWMVVWLHTNYPRVAIRFIIHDTEAMEVTEDEFFENMQMGGTAMSSGLRLAEKIMDTSYPEGTWNRYVAYFSDGDNWESDNPDLLAVTARLASKVELLAYGQLTKNTTYYQHYLTTMRESGGKRNVFAYDLHDRSQIRRWLQYVFGGSQSEAKVAGG